MKKQFNAGFLLASGMIMLAAAMRLLPHLPNFTPIAAMALFGGAYFAKKQWAFLIPMAALFLSDLIIGFHSTMWAVYVSFALVVGIGMFLQRKISVRNVILAAISSSVLFFVISNFGVWISGFCGYPMTFAGLMTCYEMAIPFFRNEILGTLVYSTVMFGSFEWIKAKYPKFQTI